MFLLRVATRLSHLISYAGARRCRKSQLDFKSRPVLEHFDPRPVKTGNGSHDTEPKAASGSAPASFEPVKTFENVLLLISWKPRPVIGNRDNAPAIAVLNLDRHLTPFTAMFDGIIDKVGDCIEQQISITSDKHVLIADHAKMPAAFFRRSIEQFHDVARNVG